MPWSRHRGVVVRGTDEFWGTAPFAPLVAVNLAKASCVLGRHERAAADIAEVTNLLRAMFSPWLILLASRSGESVGAHHNAMSVCGGQTAMRRVREGAVFRGRRPPFPFAKNSLSRVSPIRYSNGQSESPRNRSEWR